MKQFMKKTLLASLLAAPLLGSTTVGYAAQDIIIENDPNAPNPNMRNMMPNLDLFADRNLVGLVNQLNDPNVQAQVDENMDALDRLVSTPATDDARNPGGFRLPSGKDSIEDAVYPELVSLFFEELSKLPGVHQQVLAAYSRKFDINFDDTEPDQYDLYGHGPAYFYYLKEILNSYRLLMPALGRLNIDTNRPFTEIVLDLEQQRGQQNDNVNVQPLRVEIDRLTRDKQDLGTQVGQLTRQNQDLGTQVGQLTRQNQDLGTQVGQLTRQNQDLDTQVNRLTQEYQNMAGQVNRLTQENQDQEDRVDRLTQDNQDLADQVDRLTQENRDLQRNQGNRNAQPSQRETQIARVLGDANWTLNDLNNYINLRIQNAGGNNNNQNLGNQNLGNQNLGNQNLGNQNLGNQNLGNQNLGNQNLRQLPSLQEAKDQALLTVTQMPKSKQRTYSNAINNAASAQDVLNLVQKNVDQAWSFGNAQVNNQNQVNQNQVNRNQVNRNQVNRNQVNRNQVNQNQVNQNQVNQNLGQLPSLQEAKDQALLTVTQMPRSKQRVYSNAINNAASAQDVLNLVQKNVDPNWNFS